MKPKNLAVAASSIVVSLSLAGAGCAAATAFEAASAQDLEALARAALQETTPQTDVAIELLREAGPAGMASVLALLDRGESVGGAALDRVCGVADCAAIRLFWYTDLEAAKAEALATGKPILSLRLLGRLDEELSCANSRFFRTALYPNREIGELLREQFVLHWHSVRPVPKVTIDFGDGRTLRQTVTGNSLHYLLDSHGRVLDVLPGLYTPGTFQRELRAARDSVATANRLEGEAFRGWVTKRHDSNRERLDARFARPAGGAPRDSPPGSSVAAPPTLVGSATVAKVATEVPLVRALGLEVPDAEIERLVAERRASARMDETSRAFLLRKHGTVEDSEGLLLIESFEADMALDEVLNESRYRRAILMALASDYLASAANLDLEKLTLWIYGQLFRDPISDPWMGLVRREVYAALPLPPAPPRVHEPAFQR